MSEHKFVFFQEHARHGLKKLSGQISDWLEKQSAIEIVSTNLSAVGDQIVYTALYRELSDSLSKESQYAHSSHCEVEERKADPRHGSKPIETPESEELRSPQRLSLNSIFGKDG